MKSLCSGAMVYIDDNLTPLDIEVTNHLFTGVSKSIDPIERHFTYQLQNLYIVPGFADVHVHLREPGFLMGRNCAV